MPVHPFNLGPASMAVRDEHLAPWPRTPEVIRSEISEYYGALVYLFDITPTIFELSGVDGLERMDGRSLSGIWRGDSEVLRPMLFTAYTNAIRSVRDERWKLISYPRIGFTQLFDLAQDPLELNNLADDPAFSDELDRMRDALSREQRRADDPLAPGVPVRSNEPVQPGEPLPLEFDYGQIQRKVDRWQPDWVIEKYFVPDPAFDINDPR